MATSGDLARKLSTVLAIPFPTVDLYGRHLRAADLLTIKGHGRGAATMTATDAANWIVALCVDHERGGNFTGEVSRVLNLPFRTSSIRSGLDPDEPHLPIKSNGHAPTVGQAIPRLIEHAGTSRYNEFSVSFDSEGSFVDVAFPEAHAGLIVTYRRGEPKPRNIERTTTIHGRVLLAIADLLAA